jgi:UDPglucose 6-dehydrogenase
LHNKTIGVLGLAFKPSTDDMREAPSIEIIRRLQTEGARIKAYDPQAIENARRILPDIEYGRDAYAVAEGSDALVIVTEWDEFRQLDLARIKRLLKSPVIIDGRNIYDPAVIRSLGFIYTGVGVGNSDL